MKRMRRDAFESMPPSKHRMKSDLRAVRSLQGSTNSQAMLHGTRVFMRNRVRDQH